MEPDRTARMELFAFATGLSLDALCTRLAAALGLPTFQRGAENQTVWGACEVDGIEYDVALPDAGTLRADDPSVPDGCHASLTVSLAREHPRAADDAWILGTLVPSLGQRVSAALGCTLHHHRSWLGPGRNQPRAGVFATVLP